MNSKGFTMVELLVTISIIAILAVMATPTLVDISTQQNLNKSAVELKGVINMAQSKAAIEKKVITVYVGSRPTTPDDNVLSWMPSGSSTLATAKETIYMGPNYFIQKSATNADYDGIKKFVICDGPTASATSSRVISINRVGLIVDSGTVGGCSAK